MAKEKNPKKSRAILDKKHWIGSLILDSTIFTLGAASSIISCVHHSKEPSEGTYISGMITGANICATSVMAGCILNDIFKIRQISKLEKEKNCKVSTCSATLLCLHDSDGNIESYEALV